MEGAAADIPALEGATNHAGEALGGAATGSGVDGAEAVGDAQFTSPSGHPMGEAAASSAEGTDEVDEVGVLALVALAQGLPDEIASRILVDEGGLAQIEEAKAGIDQRGGKLVGGGWRPVVGEMDGWNGDGLWVGRWGGGFRLGSRLRGGADAGEDGLKGGGNGRRGGPGVLGCRDAGLEGLGGAQGSGSIRLGEGAGGVGGGLEALVDSDRDGAANPVMESVGDGEAGRHGGAVRGGMGVEAVEG